MLTVEVHKSFSLIIGFSIRSPQVTNLLKLPSQHDILSEQRQTWKALMCTECVEVHHMCFQIGNYVYWQYCPHLLTKLSWVVVSTPISCSAIQMWFMCIHQTFWSCAQHVWHQNSSWTSNCPAPVWHEDPSRVACYGIQFGDAKYRVSEEHNVVVKYRTRLGFVYVVFKIKVHMLHIHILLLSSSPFSFPQIATPYECLIKL